MMIWRRIGVAVAGVLVLTGCVDDDALLAPLAGEGSTAAREVVAVLDCRAEVGAGSISCAVAESKPPSGVSPVVLGGQGVYVLLESSYPDYDSEAEIFSVDVTVRNLLAQTIGTSDGVSMDEDGVWVFFHDVGTPTPANSGPITLDNADGEATITAADQPYFRYAQALTPGKRSLPKRWRWRVPAGVESFSFAVFISAAVAAEDDVVAGLPIDPTTVTAGEGHVCALSLDGMAYCWGQGAEGQLGTGTTSNQFRPTPVLGPDGGPALRFASISAGRWHTCALTVDGLAYCWGNGLQGKLGNGLGGTQAYRTVPDPVLDPLAGPVLRLVTVNTGRYHTCGLTVDGRAYCWGDGAGGLLGHGDITIHQRPISVTGPDGGPVLQFVSLDVGDNHTCALTTEGRAYCWGEGDWGRLGNDSDWDRTAPVPVSAPEGGDILQFASIAVGFYHTCGVATDGKAYCWGYDAWGQLGQGAQANRQRPVEVVEPVGGPSLFFASLDPVSSQDCAGIRGDASLCGTDGIPARLGQGAPRHTQLATGPTAPLRRLPLLAYLREGVGHTHSPRG